MNRLRPTSPRHLKQSIYAQIALGSGCGPNFINLIRLAHMAGATIGLRTYCDAAYAHLPAGCHNTHCDLASVGNHDLLEHNLLATLHLVANVANVSPEKR